MASGALAAGRTRATTGAGVASEVRDIRYSKGRRVGTARRWRHATSKRGDRPVAARRATQVAGAGSLLHEAIDDGPRQQRRHRHGRMEVRPARLLEAEAVHLAERGHRLARPREDVTLPVRNAEDVPDQLLHMIRIRHRDDPHAGRLQDAMDLRDRAERVRHVLEYLDREDV